MATSKKFSELPVASSMNNGDLFAVAQEDAQAETGYTSKSATALVVGKKLNGEIEYATDLPSFPPGDQNPLNALEYLNSKINDLYPVDSASGSIANFNTSLAMPLVALKAYIKAQGGGGTPSAPVAIVAWDSVNVYRRGGNLWDEVTELGDIDGTTGEDTPDNNRLRAKNYCPCIPNTNYYFVKGGSGNARIFYYDKGKNFLSFFGWSAGNLVVSFPANACFFRIALATQYGTTYNNDISINYPSTDTQYHAYNPQSDTFTLPLGQTIYGGYVDWKNGKLVVTHATIDLGDMAWGMYGAEPYYWFSNNLKTTVKKPTLNTEIADITCGCFPKTASINIANGSATIGIAVHTDGAIRIIYPDMPSTQSEIIADIGGNLFVYPLATPIEISLPTTMPSTIEGVQNWFADSGDIDVSFKLTSQEYTDKKIAELQALIL